MPPNLEIRMATRQDVEASPRSSQQATVQTQLALPSKGALKTTMLHFRLKPDLESTQVDGTLATSSKASRTTGQPLKTINKSHNRARCLFKPCKLRRSKLRQH